MSLDEICDFGADNLHLRKTRQRIVRERAGLQPVLRRKRQADHEKDKDLFCKMATRMSPAIKSKETPRQPLGCRTTRRSKNGSAYAIEGLTSPNGLVLGKMGHSERTVGIGGFNPDLIKNIACNKEANSCQNLFRAGVRYFG